MDGRLHLAYVSSKGLSEKISEFLKTRRFAINFPVISLDAVLCFEQLDHHIADMRIEVMILE